MFDPYARDTPSVSDPANDLFLINPDDAELLERGVKALRVWNPTEEVATVSGVTSMGSAFTIAVPAGSLWVEPLRVKSIAATGTTAGVVIHGYTD